MGAYDLYGNYYESEQAAWNAETAQMNEIENRANKQRLDKQEREIRLLKQKLKEKEDVQLKKEVNMERKAVKRGGDMSQAELDYFTDQLDQEDIRNADPLRSECSEVLVCRICQVPLTDTNRARCEDGTWRNDCHGCPWCVSCTDKHDKIDWDAVY